MKKVTNTFVFQSFPLSIVVYNHLTWVHKRTLPRVTKAPNNYTMRTKDIRTL